MIELGAVCGRFQIFHHDHLQYALAAKAKCRRLIVGITSPDKSVNPLEAVDPHRALDEANPCTYYERMKMVEAALLEAGVPREDFDIVPFPIGKPELMRFYIPVGTHLFVTILDEWGHCKSDRLKDYGYDVEVLWERHDKAISSSMLRGLITEKKEWRRYVPDATDEFVLNHGIDERIRQTALRSAH